LDITEVWNQTWFMEEEKKKTYIDNFFDKVLPYRLDSIQKLIIKNGNNGFIVGNSVTFADFCVWELIQRFLLGKRAGERTVALLEKYSEVQAYLKKRDEDPKWQRYLEKRVLPAEH